MIKTRNERPAKPIEIDLAGPDGNAMVLMATARDFGRQLGWDKDRTDALVKRMRSGNYDNLLQEFDKAFGHFVTLYLPTNNEQECEALSSDGETVDDSFFDSVLAE